MPADEYYTGGETTRRKAPKRTWVYGILIVFVLWLLLANHTIVFTEDPALVFLSKTSWTFNSCVIVESSRASFALKHPILTTRLAADQGLWIFGR